ncbi:MAG TPA: ABC transporter permease [Bacteroidota bacterium]
MKHPLYSAINIGGLAVGLACTLLIILYVQDELSFDSFHADAERIYRVVEERQTPDGVKRYFANTMGTIAPALLAEFPDVQAAVRIRDRAGLGRVAVGYGEYSAYVGDHLMVESSFFNVFDFKLLQGNAETALSDPRSIVLTERSANQYFGSENPIGKILKTDRFGDLKVTGIVQNPPKNSHLDFNMLFPFAIVESIEGWKRFINSWDSDGFITYVKMKENISVDEFNAKLLALVEQRRTEQEQQARIPSLQTLTNIHFGSAHLEADNNSSKGEIAYLYVFSAVGLFVLAIASINYMNLATARSMKRTKEIGMRKVAGAHRGQVAMQFFSESVLFSVLSFVVAILIVELILPAFNALANKTLALELASHMSLVLGIVALVLTVGVISGSYPAIYLSRLSPAAAFKSEVKTGTRTSFLRRSLVVVQFSLSIIMIIATFVVSNQLDFIRTKNLGFNQEQLVVIDINSGAARRDFVSIKNEMGKIPAVKSVSVSSRVPGEWKNITQINAVPEAAPETDIRTMYFMAIDEQFLNTFEIPLAEGRNLSSEMGTDTTAVIINETAARVFGWDAPVGKEIRVPEENFVARVVGVVKDFHFQSLHENIGPLVLGHWNNPFYPIDYFTCRITTSNVQKTLAELEQVHKQFDRVTPFEFNFLNERLNDFYLQDQRVGAIFRIAASLTIVIACLGLLGLAVFAAELRTKEIGVRKVLGASAAGIVRLLSMDFIKLVLIANLIAWPVAYYAMHQWLQDFAYRIELTLWVFALAGGVALLIALLTVSMQALKAAFSNPVEALRHE